MGTANNPQKDELAAARLNLAQAKLKQANDLKDRIARSNDALSAYAKTFKIETGSYGADTQREFFEICPADKAKSENYGNLSENQRRMPMLWGTTEAFVQGQKTTAQKAFATAVAAMIDYHYARVQELEKELADLLA